MATGTIYTTPVETGTITFASGWNNSGNSYVIRSGRVVKWYIEVTGGTYSSGWNTVATLPEGYRTRSNYDNICLDNAGTSSGIATKVRTNGDVQVYPVSGNSNNLRLTGTHIT